MARIITPFAPNLVHSWVDAYGDAAGGSTAGPVERWDDPTRAFRMHFLADKQNRQGVRDPGNGNDFGNPSGKRIPPLHGYRNILEYPGPRWYDPASNPDKLQVVWDFEKLFYPTSTYWPDGSWYSSDSEKDNTGGTGSERRHFIWPRINYYMRNQGSRTAEAYQDLEAWADSTHWLRASSHVAENATRVWTPPTQVRYEINGGVAAWQGWNPTEQWSEGDWDAGADYDEDRNGKTYWDRGHMETTPQYASCIAGQRSGFVALWNIWRQVAKAWPQDTASHTADQSRSLGWAILLYVRASMVGFDFADAALIAEQCGGVTPRERLNRALQMALGSRFPSSNPYAWGGTDRINVHPDIQHGCGDQGTQWCCCDEATENGRYIGSDGVDYGIQSNGKSVFQVGILFHAINVARRYWDYVVKTTAVEPYPQAVRKDLDLFLEYGRDVVTSLGFMPSWPALNGRVVYSYACVNSPIGKEEDFGSYFPSDTERGLFPSTSPAWPTGGGIAREIIEAGNICGRDSEQAAVFYMDPDRFPGRATCPRETNSTGTNFAAPWWAQAFGAADPVTKSFFTSTEFYGRTSEKSDRDRWWTIAEVAYAAGENSPLDVIRIAGTGRSSSAGSGSAVGEGGGGGTISIAGFGRSGGVGSAPQMQLRIGGFGRSGGIGSGNVTSSGLISITGQGRSTSIGTSGFFGLTIESTAQSRSAGSGFTFHDGGGGGDSGDGQAGGGPRLSRGALPSVVDDLLPTGIAWPRAQRTLRERITGSMSAFLHNVLYRGLDLLAERNPLYAKETLRDWERVLGLPDDCSKWFDADDRVRRIIAHNRLVTEGGLSELYLIQQAATIGYEITIVYNFPQLFEVGTSRAGDRLNGRSTRFEFEVHYPQDKLTYFRVGESRAGDRLASGDDEALICLINRIKPAHTLAHFVPE